MEQSKEFQYNRAKERVAELRSFYGSLLAYAIVIPLLAWINYQTVSFAWVLFPALGWGFGLVAHWARINGYHPVFGKDWEERKIKEYMQDPRL